MSDTELTAQVTRVPYKKDSRNGFWCIIATDAGTAKGEIRWIPQTGERIKFRGNWAIYQGQREFKFSFAMPDIPDNPRAKLHYVCHLTHGIGDAMEQKIWDAYGADWLHIEPDVVPGLGDAKFKAFVDAMGMLDKSQDYVEALTWMLSIGATHNLADAAFAKWQKDTIGVVKANPYQLATLHGYGFRDADKLREKFGIGDDDERRIKAAILYLVAQEMSQGNTAVSWCALRIGFMELIGRDKVTLLNSVASGMLYKSGDLFGWKETHMLASTEAYKYEKTIWDWACKNDDN
jgi:hypothetical protein